MDNKRAAVRRRTLKAGRIVLTDRTSLDCTIRDMSDGGARLEFPAITLLPHEFGLMVVAENVIIPCEPAWQRGLSWGVRFTGARREAGHRGG
jgi:hypothetical protein